MLSLTACEENPFLPRNPYGNGGGDIAIMGASRIDLHFRRIGTGLDERTVDDIDGVKIWHQRSDEGGWIEFTIVWIDNFSAFIEFSNKTFAFCSYCRGNNYHFATYCHWQCNDRKDNLLNTYTIDFFQDNKLVLIAMTEGIRTTGMRVNSISKNGIIDITRTRFNDRTWLAVGYSLNLSIAVDNDFIPYTMSVNMQTNYVRR